MDFLAVDQISLEQLKRIAGGLIYDRGVAYYDWGRVRILEVGEAFAQCTVYGTEPYTVLLEMEDGVLYMDCDCPYASKGIVCKHEVASVLAVREFLDDQRPLRWSESLDELLQTAKKATRASSSRPFLLAFGLARSSYYTIQSWKLVPYVIRWSNLPPEVRELSENGNQEVDLLELAMETGAFARSATPVNRSLELMGCLNCPPGVVSLANLIYERSRITSTYSSVTGPLGEYLSLLLETGSPLFMVGKYSEFQKQLKLITEPAVLQLHVQRREDGVHLAPTLDVGNRSFPLSNGDDTGISVLCRNPAWVMAAGFVFRAENEDDWDALEPLSRQKELVIPVEDEAEFLENYYIPLAGRVRLCGDSVVEEVVQAVPTPRLYLMEQGKQLYADLRFGYGDYEIEYDPSGREVTPQHAGGWRIAQIQRQPNREEDVYLSISSPRYGLKRAPKTSPAGTFVLRARTSPLDFLMRNVPNLLEDGFEIYGEERLKSVRVNRSKPTLSFNISSGIDWFDLQAVVHFGEMEVSLKELRKAVRKNQRYVKLADGSIAEIPTTWIDRYRRVFTLAEEKEGALRFSQHHASLLEDLLNGEANARADAEFRKRCQRLSTFSGIEKVPLPAGFLGELRPYQKAGFEWLHFLRSFGFGGCLADDMGLGKTVQVLAFLQSLREGFAGDDAPPHASLVVVPRSLLVNWQREAARFTPDLRILEYFEKDRPRDPEAFDNYDVVITTYGIMRRDAKLLRKYKFHYLILDESQAIKNPVAKTARAVRNLNAHRRLALTGTPVENNSMELWSLFAFLNPGLLGNADYFRREFASPIERNGDGESASLLQRMVYPFILRRTKAQVAPELPPRTERIVYADMEPAQRKLYNQTRDRYRSMLLGIIEEEGIQNARMKVLEGLLRLRQISNHPRLVQPSFRGGSGKFELLQETLETLHSEGHKALVFSQFVQMLKIVREQLDKTKVPYAYLDGSTRGRQQVVDRFQEDPDIPFFLISLKAGGVGLNLTAADYVIHIDPWWNPAVEMQATDRTHRIGQDKPVFVYKMIARDSVEEKVLLLQERKKSLVEQIITTESSFFKDLSAGDVEVLFSG